MLDISESALAALDPDDLAASNRLDPKASDHEVKQSKGKELNMSYEDMGRLRDTILGQLKWVLFLTTKGYP